MNVELVAQMFKNYRSNVLFHLEGRSACHLSVCLVQLINLCFVYSHGQPPGPIIAQSCTVVMKIEVRTDPETPCNDEQ